MTEFIIHIMSTPLASAPKIKPKIIAKRTYQPILWTRTPSGTGACCYYLHAHKAPAPTPCKFAIFDLDDTLFKRDTTIEIGGMIACAMSFKDRGFHLAVVSNQYGTTKGYTTHDHVHQRFEALRHLLGSDVSFIYAYGKDKYRKPMTGMYDLLRDGKPHHLESFYCGDAAGRSGDFAVSDYQFALNCQLRFRTVPGFDKAFDPADIIPKFQLYKDLDLHGMLCVPPPLPSLEMPTLIIMIGPQGAGKSTLAKSFKQQGIAVLNRDTLKSSAKVFKAFKELIKAGQSVVIDNLNYTESDRQKYLDGVRGRYHKVCYYFDIPKNLSIHLCHMRVQQGGPYIPPVARHTYYKRLEGASSASYDEFHIIKGFPCLELDVPEEYHRAYNLIGR